MRRVLRILFFCIIPLKLLPILVAEELRIATYNLNNYLITDRYVDGRWRPSYPKPEREKAIIRQIIKDVSPDVLVLQEMGSIDFLHELRADMAREGIHYDYFEHMEGADQNRYLAVLSKRAPKGVHKHKDLNFKYFEGREVVKRGMLEMTFEFTCGTKFQLFAVHLKSRYTDKKEDLQSNLRRVREAEACRNRIIERTHDLGADKYLVVGDFNDYPSSATMRRFYRRGNLEIGALVPAADSRGELWTYFYEKESRYESVDGFVASSAFMPMIKSRCAKIVDSLGALTGSDHRMVYLNLIEPRLAQIKK
jgi:endonuclease/exonuclease/phosphatase family metal-dependent hydrolase